MKRSIRYMALMATAVTSAVFMLAVMPGNEMKAKASTGHFTVTGGTEGTDYSYDSNVLTINKGTALTISGTSTSSDTIVVKSAEGADITLSGVDIDVSATSGKCAFDIDSDSSNVTITLEDANVLKSGKFCAGLQNKNSGNLTIKGNGSLTAVGGDSGAGIGGGNNKSGSDVTISGGNVTATGAGGGAGIGGGWGESGSNITISGGTVTATGAAGGAGIGGGSLSTGSDITISGGTVTATGAGGGAGIGGGWGGLGSNITINGGTVTATGTSGGAGIGGGDQGTGSSGIKIAPAAGSIAAWEGADAGSAALVRTVAAPDSYTYPDSTPVYIKTVSSVPDSSGSGAVSGNGSAPAHVCHFEWETVREATAQEDGLEEYRCSCGIVKGRRTIPACEAVFADIMNQIKYARKGTTIKVKTAMSMSYPAYLIQALADKKVSLQTEFWYKAPDAKDKQWYTFTLYGDRLTFDENGCLISPVTGKTAGNTVSDGSTVSDSSTVSGNSTASDSSETVKWYGYCWLMSQFGGGLEK